MVLQTWLPQDILKIFFSETTGQNGIKLNRKHIWDVGTKFSCFVLIGLQAWLLLTILVSDLMIFKKSSPVKPLGQMEQYLERSTHAGNFMKLPHFNQIPKKYGSHECFVVLIG